MTEQDLSINGIKIQNSNIQKETFLNALKSKNISQERAESLFDKFNKNKQGLSQNSLDVDEQASIMAYLKTTAGTSVDDFTITSEDYNNSKFDSNKISEEDVSALVQVMSDFSNGDSDNGVDLIYKNDGQIDTKYNDKSSTYEFIEDKSGVKIKSSVKGKQRMYDDNRPRITLKNGWDNSRISEEPGFNVEDFNDCTTTEDLLKVLLEKRGVSPKDIDVVTLAKDLEYYNPSLLDKENNTLFLDPNWNRLDFPSAENLKNYYGKTNQQNEESATSSVQSGQQTKEESTKPRKTTVSQVPQKTSTSKAYPVPSQSVFVNKNSRPVHIDSNDSRLRNGTLTEPVIEVAGVIYYKINPSSGLRSETKKAFDDMAKAAKKDGRTLSIRSGWRSHSTQITLFNNAINRRGFADGVKCSAVPGYSEHETGCAIDINYADRTQINTSKNKADFQWLINNAYKFGFVLSYPTDNNQNLIYEPWHWLYVGTKEAERIHRESGGKR